MSSDSSDDEGKKKSTKSSSKPASSDPVADTNSNAKRAIAAVSSGQENPAKKARLDPINFK